MGTGKLGLIVLGVVVVALLAGGMVGCNTYNRLVELDEAVSSAWSQVENQYQRRADLIPNLVETVKGVADFERETFEAVAEARARAGQITLSPELLDDPQAFAAFEQAQSGLSSALSRLLVTVERYPQLTAGTNFRDLQVQLEGTENRIAIERRRFNQIVQRYNATIRRFPTRFIASLAGFEPKAYFSAAPGADTAPAVDFSDDETS